VAVVGAPAAPPAPAVPGAEAVSTSRAFRNSLLGWPQGVVGI